MEPLRFKNEELIRYVEESMRHQGWSPLMWASFRMEKLGPPRLSNFKHCTLLSGAISCVCNHRLVRMGFYQAVGWRIVISPATGHVTLLHPFAGLARVVLVVADFKGIRDG